MSTLVLAVPRARTCSCTHSLTLALALTQMIEVISYPVRFNLGIGVPLQCLGAHGFLSRLLFWFVAPLMLKALAVLATVAVYGPGRSARRAALLRALSYVLSINFVTFPLVNSVAFSAFDCEAFDDGTSYLEPDYAVQCIDSEGNASDEWKVIRGWAIMAIFVHAFLIPGCFLALLFSQRQSFFTGKPTELVEALSKLHVVYTPDSFFWAFIEMANKLLLVGVARVVFPGTSLQLMLAIFVALINVTVVAFRHPYRAATDNLLSCGTSLTLVIFLVLALRWVSPNTHAQW